MKYTRDDEDWEYAYRMLQVEHEKKCADLKSERLQKCYDVTNQSWKELKSEVDRLRVENNKLKAPGVYQALRYAYKNPSNVGYDTPSKEWSELLESYYLLDGLEG